MRGLLALLLVAWTASPAVAESTGSLESRVADAVAAEVRARMGTNAKVSVGHVEISVRNGLSGSVGVTLAPTARLGAPIEFGIIGAGASGRAAWMGRGRADVSVTVPHAVTARTITRGTVLAAIDVSEVLGPPGDVPLQRLPTIEQLSGATLRRDAADGEVVTAQHVVLPPAVRAGDVVQARAFIGPVEVIGELTVMDSGAEGAVVRVVNRESRKEMRARVVRAGVVEVLHE